jgi:hypothetical protein
VLTHPEIDARSRALQLLVAEKIRREPARFDGARAVLERWRAMASGGSQPYLLEWERLFQEGVERTLGVAVEESERADALRQCSPLACVLTNQERWAFLRDWSRQHDAQPT